MTEILARQRVVVPCPDGVQYLTAAAVLAMRWHKDDLLNTRAQTAQAHCDLLESLLHGFGNSDPTTYTEYQACDRCKRMTADAKRVGEHLWCPRCINEIISEWKRG
jgi:hypothetical protein